MKKTVIIRKPGMKKLDNSLHSKFHSSAYDLVTAADITKLGIPSELMTEWDGNNALETDITKVSQVSDETRLMKEKNKERDRLVTYIMGTIRNAQFLPDQDMIEASMRLTAVVKPYVGVQNESFDRETADIKGLLADLRKTENSADVTKLGLSPILTKLESANKAFDALFTKRMTANTGAKLPPASKVRLESDAIYDRVILMLQWNYLFGATPIDPKVIETLAENLCRLADRIDKGYNQSVAQRRAAAEKKKKPTDPKDPHAPKDPKPGEPKDPKTPKDPKPGEPKDPKTPKDPQPKKPKDDGKPDIHLPEEDPSKQPGGGGGSGKQPEGGSGKQPEGGGGAGSGDTGGSGNPDIHLPTE